MFIYDHAMLPHPRPCAAVDTFYNATIFYVQVQALLGRVWLHLGASTVGSCWYSPGSPVSATTPLTHLDPQFSHLSSPWRSAHLGSSAPPHAHGSPLRWPLELAGTLAGPAWQDGWTVGLLKPPLEAMNDICFDRTGSYFAKNCQMSALCTNQLGVVILPWTHDRLWSVAAFIICLSVSAASHTEAGLKLERLPPWQCDERAWS